MLTIKLPTVAETIIHIGRDYVRDRLTGKKTLHAGIYVSRLKVVATWLDLGYFERHCPQKKTVHFKYNTFNATLCYAAWPPFVTSHLLRLVEPYELL